MGARFQDVGGVWIGRVAAFLVLFGLVGAARAAVIVNGSFETGVLSPWVQDQGSASLNWSVTAAIAESGRYSATVVGNAELKESFTPVLASTIAVLSLWLEHPAAGVTTDAVDFYYSDGSSAQNYVSTTNTGFDVFDMTSRLNTSKSLSGIGVWGTSLGATYLDDVSVTLAAPLPEAPAGALLAGGLVILGVARRRG